MQNRSWLSVALLAAVAVLAALLLVIGRSPAAQAQASEGQSRNIIAVAAPIGDESLLYVLDTNREVILVYAFHYPGIGVRNRDVRSGAFEFVAGRLYRWDATLSAEREYSLKGVRRLEGLRPNGGAGSSEFEYKQLQSQR